MRFQKGFYVDKEALESFKKDIELSVKALFENWPELKYTLSFELLKDDKTIPLVVYIDIDDESFVNIEGFTKEEAIGAFESIAREDFWEPVPSSYAILHADFEDDVLYCVLKTGTQVKRYTQIELENMIKEMSAYPRVIVYSSEILTYIKDLYPNIDNVAYVLSRAIVKEGKAVPSLEELSKIYLIDTKPLENVPILLEKLLVNPVKLPSGDVNLPSYKLPIDLLNN